MSELTFRFDKKAIKNIHELQKFYGVDSAGELIRKALMLLKIAAQTEQENGELLIRKGSLERKIEIKKEEAA